MIKRIINRILKRLRGAEGSLVPLEELKDKCMYYAKSQDSNEFTNLYPLSLTITQDSEAASVVYLAMNKEFDASSLINKLLVSVDTKNGCTKVVGITSVVSARFHSSKYETTYNYTLKGVMLKDEILYEDTAE